MAEVPADSPDLQPHFQVEPDGSGGARASECVTQPSISSYPKVFGSLLQFSVFFSGYITHSNYP